MGSTLWTVRLPHVNGIAKDAVVNNFAVEGPAVGQALIDVRLALASFYALQAPGATNALSMYIGGTVDRTSQACQLKAYNLDGHEDGTPHGSPIFSDTFTMTNAPVGAAFPPQIALAVTLRASNALSSPVESVEAGLPIRPRARRTGRVYIGPLNLTAANGAGTSVPRPSTTFRTDLLAAFEKLSDDLNAAGCSLCVWSRSTEYLHEVTRVEVDDSFDVIRSRKAAPTLRDVRTFAPVPDLVPAA